MSSAPRAPGAASGAQLGLGSLAAAGARLTLKVALNTALQNGALVQHLAAQLYESETLRTDWKSLTAGDRAIWQQRVHVVISSLGTTIGGV